MTDAARLAQLHLTVDGVRLLSERAILHMRHVVDRGGRTDLGLAWA